MKSPFLIDPAQENHASSPAAHPPDFPRPLAIYRILPALVILLLGVALIPWLAWTFHPVYKFSNIFPKQYIDASKQFVSSFTIFVIIAVIWIFDPRRRPALVTLLVAMLLGGACNGIIKEVAGRARPTYSMRMRESNNKWNKQYLGRNPQAQLASPGKDHWLGFSPQRPFFHEGYASFPSGHSNTAFVLAAFLILLYPRGSWLWLLIATGCALSRVAQLRHFHEDVMVGAALGWLIAQLVFSWSWPYKLGRRLLGSKPGDPT